MKIISYSDLHLEFRRSFRPPADNHADVMILAGDILTFRDFSPLDELLHHGKKPVIFVVGNHEYYTLRPMDAGATAFREWLGANYPNVLFLQDEGVTIDGVQFFGGTMWTDFAGMNRKAMADAEYNISDYRQIMLPNGKLLKPSDTVAYHISFVSSLERWFEQDLPGQRVVISHHAPVINPLTQYGEKELTPVFNSLVSCPPIIDPENKLVFWSI